ncbi:hypothetical protein Droror1_Dr00012517 [Drosera rotundifolia]
MGLMGARLVFNGGLLVFMFGELDDKLDLVSEYKIWHKSLTLQARVSDPWRKFSLSSVYWKTADGWRQWGRKKWAATGKGELERKRRKEREWRIDFLQDDDGVQLLTLISLGRRMGDDDGEGRAGEEKEKGERMAR